MPDFALLDRVKLRLPTDLPDAELLAMIDAIAAELDARFGAAGAITVELGDPLTPGDRLFPTLRLIDPGNTGLASHETVLDAADFRVLHGGRTLQRLTGGPNARTHWAPLVRVAYTPVGLAAARDEVTIKLIALDLSYRGSIRSERAGDYQITLSGDMGTDREAILRTLEDRRGMVMA
jgi:hypothetical protein